MGVGRFLSKGVPRLKRDAVQACLLRIVVHIRGGVGIGELPPSSQRLFALHDTAASGHVCRRIHRWNRRSLLDVWPLTRCLSLLEALSGGPSR